MPRRKPGEPGKSKRPPKPHGPKPGVLTEQQKLFIRFWLIHRNGSRAARQAGYSPHNAADTAHRLLRDPQFQHVQLAIQDALADEKQRFSGLKEAIVDELSYIAFADPADLHDEDGELLPLHKMDPEARRTLSELKATEFLGEDGAPSTSRKVRQWSKPEALNTLAKITGLMKDRLDLNADVDIRRARAELENTLAGLVPRESLDGGAGGEEPGGEGEAPAGPDGSGVP